MTWLPPERPPARAGLGPWQPNGVAELLGVAPDWDSLGYVVVDELHAGVAGLVVSRWPRVDERGRLHFGGESESSRIATLAPALQTLLLEERRTVVFRNRFDSYGVDINNASIALKLDFPSARTYERQQDRMYLRLPTLQTLILGADAQTLSWSQVLIDFPQLGPVKTAVTTALRRSRGAEPLRAQVFKVPHHGSKHGLNLELVEAVRPAISIVSSVRHGGRYEFPHELTQTALREALDPISSKPGNAYRADTDLNILYTGSNEIDSAALDSDDAVLRPLGSIAILVGAGGRREIWRFGDSPNARIALADGRPMTASVTGTRRQPLPAVPRQRAAPAP